MNVLTVEQRKQLERDSFEYGLDFTRLIENAGSAAAQFIRTTLQVKNKKCVILCGRGDNGGDGLVVARKLWEDGADITVVLTGGVPKSPHARSMYELIARASIKLFDLAELPVKSLEKIILSADVVVDAIFGTGFSGVIPAFIPEISRYLRHSNATVFALDVPSGINASTGEADEWCIKADYTVSFIALKPGLVTYPAVEFCGKIEVADIGIPAAAMERYPAMMMTVDEQMVRFILPRKHKNSNKGDFGRLLCLCGSDSMPGAAVLSAGAAVRSGVGLCSVAASKYVCSNVAQHYPEVVHNILSESRNDSDVLLTAGNKSSAMLIGPGLGVNGMLKQKIHSLISSVDIPIIIDADGINMLCGDIDILKEISAPIILTPHPGEMARLIGCSASEVQANRHKIARDFAKEYGVTLVLKGAHTIVASKLGTIFVNLTGNPGLAKGGSGDVLSGVIASFVAQGISPIESAIAGVYIHGAAADIGKQRYSEYAMIPSDVINMLSEVFCSLGF